MRIGIIADVLDQQYAGIYYYTKHLIGGLLALDNNEHEYFLIRSHQGKEGYDCQEIIIRPHSWPGYPIWRKLVQIPRKAKALDLDILIEPAHFGPFNLPTHIKRVTVIHDLTPLIHPEWHPWYSALGHRLLIKKIVHNADLVITNSQYTKQDIVKYLDKNAEDIIAAPLGISDIFTPSKNDHTLGKYGIYKKYILYQATLEPRKNLINLVQAYEIYRTQNPSSVLQLILSGKKGWNISDLHNKIQASRFKDDIILLGYVEREDMPALFTGASLFIYPSLYEGYGMPILEAMACGTTVATSEVSSLPEVGDKYALYFNPQDCHQMASTIKKALTSTPHNRQAQIAYAKSFTWLKTAQIVQNALENL